MDEDFLIELGFSSRNEFDSLVCMVPVVTKEEKKRFREWQENDGTKAGLIKLLKLPDPKKPNYWTYNGQEIKQLSISFSGGETSAYMTKRLLDETADTDTEVTVYFANTGQENEETLEFVRDCDNYFGFNTVWIEAVVHPKRGKGATAKVVTFETASRNGEPFEAMIQKFGIPNMSFPRCSTVLKTEPLNSMRRGKKCYVAIGIRADEFDRASVDVDKQRLIYPMIEWDITKPDINRFWSEQPFRLNLKGYEGNCKTCWKKSFRKLMTIAVESPEKFDFFREMERKYENHRPIEQPNRPLPARFFRKHKTVDDIFEMAAHPGWQKADDDSIPTISFSQGSLFNFEELISVSSGCEESCEAF